MSFDHLEVRRSLLEAKAKIDNLLSYMDANQLEPDRTVVDDEIGVALRYLENHAICVLGIL